MLAGKTFRSLSAVATATAIAITLTSTACNRDTAPVVTIETADGPIVVHVELARTREELQQGLMWRDELAEDAGMLFVFPKETRRSFWMKNTPLPLDIVFIDSEGRIVSIAEATTPYSEARIPSEGPSRFVLEVNAGFAARHGLRAGMRVVLPDLSRL